MAIQYPNFPKLNAQDVGGLGGFDLGGAIRSGFQNANLFQEARYKPRNLENAVYAQELANKINQAKAGHAEESESLGLKQKEETINHLAAQTALSQGNLGLIPYYKKLYSAQASTAEARANQARQQQQQDMEFNNLISNKNSNHESIQVPLRQNIGNGLNANKNEQIITTGNPNLQNINEIYDNYPQYRKKLEAMGYKKTQTVKYDPKTGTTSVITKMPNGEVKISNSLNESDTTPATIAIKTSAQKTITGINNARPIIEKLIAETEKGEIPGQVIGKYFKPDTQAAYESDVIQSSDTLAAALGYPATNEGLHQATQTILRRPRESDKGYAKRLKTLLTDMDKREETAQNNLSKGIKVEKNTTNGRMKYNPSTGRLE